MRVYFLVWTRLLCGEAPNGSIIDLFVTVSDIIAPHCHCVWQWCLTSERQSKWAQAFESEALSDRAGPAGSI